MLHEKHRPKTLKQVAGLDGAVARLEAMIGRNDFENGAFIFQGPSGCGKTTLAHALAHQFCDDRDITVLKGADVIIETVRELEYTFGLSAWGESGWKAAIVDEAHAMSPKSIQGWLTLLEPLRSKRLVLFTTTEPLTTDLFGNFTSPFASRCQTFSLRPNLAAFALRAREIALNEGLCNPDDANLDVFEGLVSECGCNLRQVLQRIDAGEMMDSGTVVELKLRTMYRKEGKPADAVDKIIAEIDASHAERRVERVFSGPYLPELTPAMRKHLARLSQTGNVRGAKPSTLKRLAAMGLVSLTDGKWTMTPAGQAAVA